MDTKSNNSQEVSTKEIAKVSLLSGIHILEKARSEAKWFLKEITKISNAIHDAAESAPDDVTYIRLQIEVNIHRMLKLQEEMTEITTELMKPFDEVLGK